MAAFKKKEQRKGPKPYEIIIGALLSLILGALLGVVYLIVQPVEEVDSTPPEAAREARTVYYQEGAIGTPGQYNWRPKLGALVNGTSGTLEIVEEELNQWVATEFDWEETSHEGFFVIAPRSLNFRIYDNTLQIASELNAKVLGIEKSVIAQAHGAFVQRNGTFVYSPERLYIGGMQVPHQGIEALLNRFMEILDIPEELKEGWGRLSDVTIEDSILILEIP